MNKMIRIALMTAMLAALTLAWAETSAVAGTSALPAHVIERFGHPPAIPKGPLTQDQRTRLMEIADKCPVHRTLEASVHITTELLAYKRLYKGRKRQNH